jgi:hypothetical protein
MQGFNRYGQFSRAIQASRMAAAEQWNPFAPQVQDLQFAEGLLFAIALVLPFWITLGYAIRLLAR